MFNKLIDVWRIFFQQNVDDEAGLNIRKAYCRLFNTDDGKLVLGHLLAEYACLDKSIFNENQVVLGIQEGKRILVNDIARMADNGDLTRLENEINEQGKEKGEQYGRTN